MSPSHEQELDRLFAACRSADVEIEPSVEFDAALWRKIEAARPLSAEQELDGVFARARRAFDATEMRLSESYLTRLWRRIEGARPVSVEQELELVFARARRAYPDPEPSVSFMPRLWSKIEDARPLDGWLDWVRSWAPRLAAAGALAAGLLIGAVWTQPSRDSVALEAGYVDHLTEQSLDEHDVALWMSAGLPRQ